MKMGGKRQEQDHEGFLVMFRCLQFIVRKTTRHEEI